MKNNNHLELLFNEIEPFNRLISKVEKGKDRINIKYLNGSSISLLIDYLQRNIDRPVIVISNNTDLLEDISFDFENFFQNHSVANLIEKKTSWS